MKLGNYTIDLIETGYVSLDGGAMFGVVPKTLWSKSNPADEKNRIILAMRLLLIRDGQKNILVDTGVGTKMNEKLSKIYNVDTQKYDLLSGLNKYGLKPEDITDVIVTHMHFDHIGGATYFDKKGEAQLTFPNATHHVQKRHWQWAMQPSEKDGASFMPENYMAIKQENRLNLIDGEGTLFPGIDLLTFNGHTPAMQAPKITADGKTLFYAADLFPTATHIPLPYIMGYDVEPLATLAEKKRILPQAVEEDWIFLYEHDPYHIASTVQHTEKGFKAGEEITI